MATLGTNATRLAQIQRSRQLAAALQSEAMNFEPIRSPWQGVAKLAQVMVGNVINKSATARENKFDEERQKAFADALAPVQEQVMGNVPQPSQVPLGDTAGVLNQMTGNPADLLQQQPTISRPKTTQEMLAAMPSNLGEQAMTGILQQKIMADLGITPQQLSSRLAAQRDQYTSPKVYEVQQSDGSYAEQLLVREKASPGRFGSVGKDGAFAPVDSSKVRDPIDRTTDVPWTSGQRLEQMEVVSNGMIALNQINRLEENVRRGGLTEETLIGNTRSLAETVRTSWTALGDTVEVIFKGKQMTDSGQLGNVNNFAGYGESRVTEQDRQKYSESTIKENLEAWKSLQRLDASTQQLSISIAYTLARIADPGGRLSEMDVINQMKGLGLDSPSQERRLAALDEAKRTFAITMQSKLGLAKMNGLEVVIPPEFSQQLERIINTPRLQGGGGSDLDELLNQPPAIRRQLERQYGLRPGSLDNG